MKDTKERILTEGLDLLTTAGFNNITVGALAQRTGMSKSGLFAHFRSKEAIQLALLEETLRVGTPIFVEPAMHHAPGLERLRAIVCAWLGWTKTAGLQGGCPIAAGLFEYDDAPVDDPVRSRLRSIEEHWRRFLETMTSEAVEAGDLRADLDVGQFVWELCGIYLNHHVSERFLSDPEANGRTAKALECLIQRSLRRECLPEEHSSLNVSTSSSLD